MRAAWRTLADHRDLRLVLAAGLVSLSGDWILRVGLLYRVYVMTGSTVAAALAMGASFAPQLLIGPVAGVFADRWDRRRTMVTTNLLLAAGLLPLLAVRGPGQVWLVFVVLLWEGAVQQFFSPAEQALVPRLVRDDELLVANALSGQVRDVSRLAGSALGGVIAAVGAIAAVTLADAASFIISAVLLTSVRTSGRVERPAWGERRLAAVARDLLDGLRLSARHRFLRALMIFVLVTSVGEGVMGTLVAPFVRNILHGSSQAFGVVAAAQAIGGITGGVVAAALSQRVPASRLFCYGAIAFGLIDLAIFLYPLGYVAVWPAVAGMIVVGVPGALSIAGLITLFQHTTADSHRGRIFGALSAIEGTAVLAGTLAAGYLSRPLGIVPVLAAQGAGYALAGLGMAVWLRGREDCCCGAPGQEADQLGVDPGAGHKGAGSADRGHALHLAAPGPDA